MSKLGWIICLVLGSFGLMLALFGCNSERFVQNFKSGDVIYVKDSKATIQGKATLHNEYPVLTDSNHLMLIPVDSLFIWNGWEN